MVKRLVEVLVCLVVIILGGGTSAAGATNGASMPVEALAPSVVLHQLTAEAGSITDQPSQYPGPQMQFSTTKVGWVLWGGSAIYRTADGGVSWRDTHRGPLQPRWIDAIGTRNAWVLAVRPNNRPAGLLRTKDAGAIWISLPEPRQGVLSAIDFVSATMGWALTQGGVVLRTEDGGQHWRVVNAPEAAGTLCATTARHIWLGGANGDVYDSSDSGATWNQSLPYDQFLGLPSFAASTPPASPLIPWLSCSGPDTWALYDLGEAAGSSAYIVFASANDGSTWAAMLANQLTETGRTLPSVSNTMDAVGSSPGGFGWFLGYCGPCGSTGTADIVTTTGSSPSKAIHLPGVAPYGLDASFVDPTQGWVLGANPSELARPPSKYGYRVSVFSTVDGGATWRKVGTIPMGT